MVAGWRAEFKHVYLIGRDPADPTKKVFVPEAKILEQVSAVFHSIKIPTTLMDSIKGHMRASHEAEQRYHREAVAALRRQHDTTNDKLRRLLDVRIEGSITQSEYDEKATELRQSLTALSVSIAEHEKGEEAFRTTLESLISIAARAGELFERSKIDQKRQLMAFMFSNLQLRGKKLDFSLRSPFHLMVNRAEHSSWLGD